LLAPGRAHVFNDCFQRVELLLALLGGHVVFFTAQFRVLGQVLGKRMKQFGQGLGGLTESEICHSVSPESPTV
jgi:hypothetical protein